LTVFYSTGALILTGSRASLVGVAISIACAALILLRSRPRIGLAVGVALTTLSVLAVNSSAFAGRGLNLLTTDDVSAQYRRQVQSRLWEMPDIWRVDGLGFSQGNVLADNSVTSGLPNIDNAWLSLLLSIGFLGAAGIAMLVFAVYLRALREHPLALLLSLPWFILVTSAENVWMLSGPAIVTMLCIVAGTYGSRDECASNSAPVVEHALGWHGSD
jgi:hypothetical protein